MRGEGEADGQTNHLGRVEVAEQGHELSDPHWQQVAPLYCTTLKSFPDDDSQFNTYSLDNNQRRQLSTARGIRT